MRLYAMLLSASLQGQLSYRRSFWLEVAGRFWVVGLELVAVLVLFSHIDDLGGWTRWEVVYLYGVASLALGIAELLTDGLREMPQLVRMGTLDGLLLRPVSPLLQVLGRQCRPLHLGRAAQGVLGVAGALYMLGEPLGPLQGAMVAVNVFASALVYCTVFVMGAATCIFTVQSAEAFNAFTYGGVQMTQYPTSIFPHRLRSVFLWVVPVGMTSYFPALVVLDKVDSLGFPAFMPFVAPVVAVVFASLGAVYWRFCLSRYLSTGS